MLRKEFIMADIIKENGASEEEMEEVAASIIPTTEDTTESATEENEVGALSSDDELDMEGFEVSEM